MLTWKNTAAIAALSVLALSPVMSAQAASTTNLKTIYVQDETVAQQYMLQTQMNTMHDWMVITGYASNQLLNNSTWTPTEIQANVKTTTDYARFSLAVLAAHLDPHQFDGKNYIQFIASAQIKSGADAGKFADNVDGTGADSIVGQDYAIFALVDAGGVTFDKTAAVNWLIAHQDKDGGFSYSVKAGTSDADDTAFTLEALSLLGTPTTAPVMTTALAYLKSQQAPDGGMMGYNKVGDADSTGVTIDALTQLGISATSWTTSNDNKQDNKQANTLVSSLLSDFDQTTGGFKYDTSGVQYSGVNGYATRDAIIGLSSFITGHSLYSRLMYTPLTYVNPYWTSVEKNGGAWVSGQWQTWTELAPMAIAASEFSHLNRYWQGVANQHGMWIHLNGKAMWETWNPKLARAALVASVGLDSIDVARI